MRKKLFAAAFAALLTGTPYAAFAQDAPPPPGPGGMAMRGDANHDGTVTRDEMLADVDQRFAKMDTNHDGKITPEESNARRQEAMARRGDMAPPGPDRVNPKLDTDGDGAISLAEQRAQATRRFDMVDTNHDGRIDQAETEAARARMMERRARHGPPTDDMPPPPPADAPDAPQGN